MSLILSLGNAEDEYLAKAEQARKDYHAKKQQQEIAPSAMQGSIKNFNLVVLQ